MLLGSYSFFQSLSVLFMIGTLSCTSTHVFAQEALRELPHHTNTTPSQNLSDSEIELAETPTYITPAPIMETSYDLLLSRGNVLSLLTPDQSSDEMISPLVRASEKEAEGIPGFQHIVATLSLRKENPQKVMLVRSEKFGTFDTLIVDRSLDGSFLGEARITIDKESLAEDETLIESRDAMHMVEFQTALMTEHLHPKYLPRLGDYPAILRIKWTDLNTTPKELIWFGYYFYQTEINVADKTYQVLLHDINNDGKITDIDRWILKNKNAEVPDDSSREITDFNWVDGIAWKINLQTNKGNRGYIYRYDPKISYKEDMDTRDPWSDDKNSVRAEKKNRVTILTDHDTLIKKAAEEQKLSILKFENTWCESCSAISIFVLPQQRVVNASTKYIWARFNNEDHADITSQYNITQYPTFVVLNSEGKELTRFHKVTGDTLVTLLREGLDLQKAQETPLETLVSDDSPALIEMPHTRELSTQQSLKTKEQNQ